MKILVAYASRYGSTQEVAETVAAELQQRGLDVDVRPAAGVASLDGYDALVLGSGLYAGRLHRDARRLLKRQRHGLEARPFAVFAMGPSTLEADEVAGSRQQLERGLRSTGVPEPLAQAIFGGVVDPTKFRFPLNRLPASDARDWNAIAAWAADVAEQLDRAPVPA